MNSNYTWVLFLYNIVAVISFVVLAILFNHWWIALFSLLFLTSQNTIIKRRRKCDMCGAYSEGAETIEEAIKKAEKAGWIHIAKGDKDYCPECRKELNL